MKTKRAFAILLFIMVPALLFTGLSFGQEMPKPGTMIDKNNCKQYAHLFPPEFLGGFENGWGGLYHQITIKASQTKPAPLPPKFIALSEKNRGKFGFDQQGLVSGGWDYIGLPFPDLSRGDKDFATKLIWNAGYKYHPDDFVQQSTIYQRRKGEAIQYFMGPRGGCERKTMYFTNRLYEDPKPFCKTPNNLQYANFFQFYAPGLQGMLRLETIKLDPRATDDTFMYLPPLRRTLRMDASARATPQTGTLEAADDFSGFAGKPYRFTYEFVKEQKVLAVATGAESDPMLLEKDRRAGLLYFPHDNWEARDVYVVIVKSKDPKYPQSKKILYIDKENYNVYYAVAYDRAGKLWKLFIPIYAGIRLPDGAASFESTGMIDLDLQDDVVGYTCIPIPKTMDHYKADFFNERELVKIGK